MEKYTSLDDFITAIVLNFESNEIINRTLSKISGIIPEARGTNLEIIDNIILYKLEGKDKETRKIEVDVANKKIKTEETGIKKIKDGIRNYDNKYNYSVIGNKSINYSFEKQYDIKKQENGNTLIKTKISNKYSYFNQTKYIGSSQETEKKDIIKNKCNQTIDTKEESIQKIEYALPTGDFIKTETINDQTKYYFYSKNQNEDNSFYKEITKKDVDRLLSLGDNIYDVINDQTVYEMRGSSYN